MSSIGFSDGVESVDLAGRERAYMGCYCSDLAIQVLGSALEPRFRDGEYAPPPILEYVPETSYLHGSWQEFQASLSHGRLGYGGIRYPTAEARTRLSSSMEAWLSVGGFTGEGRLLIPVEGFEEPQPMDGGDLALNTALAHGGDEVRLMARLHGQCEAHCWVSGGNRGWLADLIEAGLRKHIFRAAWEPEHRSWEGVVEFLRRRDDVPVVCDYSVSETFPYYGFIADYLDIKRPETDDDWEKWYEWDADERWQQGLEAIAARERRLAEEYETWTFELRPEGFADLRYSYGFSAFDLSHLLWTAERVEV